MNELTRQATVGAALRAHMARPNQQLRTSQCDCHRGADLVAMSMEPPSMLTAEDNARFAAARRRCDEANAHEQHALHVNRGSDEGALSMEAPSLSAYLRRDK